MDLIESLRRLSAIKGRPFTAGERAEAAIAMSEAADALEAALEDGARLDWMASQARYLSERRDTARWEMPAIQIDSGRDQCTPADLRAAIDADKIAEQEANRND